MPFCSCPAWAQTVADQIARLMTSQDNRERFNLQVRKWATGFVYGWTDRDFDDFVLRWDRKGQWQHLVGCPPQATFLIPLPARPLTVAEKYSVLAAIHNACVDGDPINPWNTRIERNRERLPDGVVTNAHMPPVTLREVYATPEDQQASCAFSALFCDVCESQEWQVPESSRVAIESILREVVEDSAKVNRPDINLQTDRGWFDCDPPADSRYQYGPIEGRLRQFEDAMGIDRRTLRARNGKSWWYIRSIHKKRSALWCDSQLKRSEIEEKVGK